MSSPDSPKHTISEEPTLEQRIEIIEGILGISGDADDDVVARLIGVVARMETSILVIQRWVDLVEQTLPLPNLWDKAKGHVQKQSAQRNLELIGRVRHLIDGSEFGHRIQEWEGRLKGEAGVDS